MIRGVLFDLDDTLTDRPGSMAAYARRMREDFGARLAPVEPEVLLETLIRADRGGYHEGQRSPDLIRDLPWRDAPDSEELDAHWEAVAADVAIAREGAHEVLETLRKRGLTLGIVTNGLHSTQHAKLRGLGLSGAFDVVVVSESAGCEKPDPRIYEIARVGLGVDAPADVCFVGDHPENDALGARRCGLRAIWLDVGHAWPEGEAPPERAARRLDEVPGLLESLV